MTEATPVDYAHAAVRVRESARARHVRVRVLTRGEVEVVVPPGFDRARLPRVLADAAPWIRRAQARAVARHAALPPALTESLPGEIHLAALARRWRVDYRDAARRRWLQTDERLLVHGPPETRRGALHAWLLAQGRAHLPPWLAAVAAEAGLPFSAVSVRRQRARWGSCTARGAISLNCKLLFMPPPLVRHVMLHELCHTRHLNHSARFHHLLERLDARSGEHRQALAEAWRYVPLWAD